MTRYRRPEPAGSKYATAEGARRLQEELDYLWRVHRPQVTRAVAEAAAQGDRSENAEYIYGKKQLREIDRRVRYLRKRLDGLVVVSRPPDDRSRVFFGAWVRIEDEEGHDELDGADRREAEQALEVALLEDPHDDAEGRPDQAYSEETPVHARTQSR